MALGVLYEVVIETPNPRTLAHFWSALIGGEVDVDGDDWAAVDTDEVSIVFVHHTARPSGRSLISLSVEVDDLAAATSHAEDLGAAKQGDATESDDTLRQTMVDPGGHEFTLVCSIEGDD